MKIKYYLRGLISFLFFLFCGGAGMDLSRTNSSLSGLSAMLPPEIKQNTFKPYITALNWRTKTTWIQLFMIFEPALDKGSEPIVHSLWRAGGFSWSLITLKGGLILWFSQFLVIKTLELDPKSGSGGESASGITNTAISVVDLWDFNMDSDPAIFVKDLQDTNNK